MRSYSLPLRLGKRPPHPAILSGITGPMSMNDTLIIRRISTLPANVGAFVCESGAAMGELYGADAAEYYLAHARANLEATVGHVQVYTLGAFEGADAVGMLMAVQRMPAVHVSYVHVLKPHEGRGIESRLVEHAVAEFRYAPCDHILCEYVPVGRLDLLHTFSSYDFAHIPRLVMTAPLNTPELTVNDGLHPPLGPKDWDEAGRCFVDAYRGDPGRRLHIDMTDDRLARAFVSRVAAGGFGRFRPEYAQAVMEDGVCAGVALGCEVAPDTGFILQVAVRPAFRGAGMGAELVRELAAAFRANGLRQVALGVSVSNPARALYERLGFRGRKAVDAFVWWRTGRES